MNILVKPLDSEELKAIWMQAFGKHGLHREAAYYDQCLHENVLGTRVTLLAFVEETLVGCGHLKVESEYAYFREGRIPEINDLNVFPDYRRNGIGNKLLEQFEALASEDFHRIGLGVGLYKDYGAAQRIYCRRGYVPDGNGLMSGNREAAAGETVRVDDDLLLYLIKDLRLDSFYNLHAGKAESQPFLNH
ncbi:GNAT family N-acetyltransferase [Paenibacillus sp. UNC499MF]|uniref:GNAT family N-acetyltransferase n=1 Tax=Paenibacillus sp. UNC499MF TaxID=1502751 RepID=UPI0008A0856C|nr:GNAT family N-acetyltransferase [Paenibacillus sp. UNC499MF]SEF46478.1 Ribosomal protein S18 acetylase RimI [Paenibacillus sp. UNC499MF]